MYKSVCLLMWMCSMDVWLVPEEEGRRHQIPWSWRYRWCELSCALGNQPSSSARAQTLTCWAIPQPFHNLLKKKSLVLCMLLNMAKICQLKYYFTPVTFIRQLRNGLFPVLLLIHFLFCDDNLTRLGLVWLPSATLQCCFPSFWKHLAVRYNCRVLGLHSVTFLLII